MNEGIIIICAKFATSIFNTFAFKKKYSCVICKSTREIFKLSSLSKRHFCSDFTKEFVVASHNTKTVVNITHAFNLQISVTLISIFNLSQNMTI